MEKEMASSRTRHSVLNLVRTPVLRRISICLCFVWYGRQWGTPVGGCPSPSTSLTPLCHPTPPHR